MSKYQIKISSKRNQEGESINHKIMNRTIPQQTHILSAHYILKNGGKPLSICTEIFVHVGHCSKLQYILKWSLNQVATLLEKSGKFFLNTTLCLSHLQITLKTK